MGENLIGGRIIVKRKKNDEYQGNWAAPRYVYFAGNANEPPIDLDWGMSGITGRTAMWGSFCKTGLRRPATPIGYGRL